MFTCPKCKKEWSYFTSNCVCGEQVLFISPELKEESFRIYESDGIEAVKKLIIARQKYRAEKSDRTSQAISKILEDQKNIQGITAGSNESIQSHPNQANFSWAAIAITSSVILFLTSLYFVTPMMVEFAGSVAECNIEYKHWGFIDYIRFWLQFIMYSILLVLAIVFAIVVFYIYAKSEQEKPDNSTNWVKTGAVIGALTSKSAVHGAIKGAATGYAGHSILGAIGLIIIFIIALYPLSLWGDSIKNNMCSSSATSESVATKPDNLDNVSVDANSNGKQRFLSVKPPSNQENLNCKLLAQYIVNDLRRQVEPHVSNVSIQSLSITNVYFEEQDELSCRGWVNLSNNNKALLDFYGSRKGGVYKITYQAASGD